MPAPAYTYQLTNGTTADASQVMQDFNDILNGVTDGTKDLTINALTANGATNLKGDVTVGASASNIITWNGSLGASIPVQTDNSFDLGTSTQGFRSIYFGANSHRVRVVGSASMSANWTFTLPVTAGTNNYLLTTDGSGNSSWSALSFSSMLSQYNNANSWTPTLKCGTTSQSPTTQVGRFWQVDKLVFYSGRFTLSGGIVGSGALTITGLPATSANFSGCRFHNCNGNISGVSGIATKGGSFQMEIPENSSVISLNIVNASGNTAALQGTDVSSGVDILFSGWYMTT